MPLLVAAAGCYLLKLVGLAVPARVLDRPVLRRIVDLLPVALLAALVVVQTLAIGTRIVVDARLAGLAAAVAAILLRAPFLVVVLAAAVTTALLRLA
jgi:hypothetical protein